MKENKPKKEGVTSMDRAIKDIAKELGTNKNVIYRIIGKLALEPVPNDDKKAPKVYSEESFNSIKNEYRNLQNKHIVARVDKNNNSDNQEIILTLRQQIERYEDEITRLNNYLENRDKTISEKDKQIIDLTDKLTKALENNHLETIRYQELLAREQNTKLLLTAQSQTRFNLFKPSTWKRNKAVDTPDLEPLTPDEQ